MLRTTIFVATASYDPSAPLPGPGQPPAVAPTTIPTGHLGAIATGDDGVLQDFVASISLLPEEEEPAGNEMV